MKNVVVVILWGVAAVSLFFSRPGDADLDVETSTSPPQAIEGGEEEVNASSTLNLILDDWPASSDTLLEDEKEYEHFGEEEMSLSLEERRLGKGIKHKSTGGGCKQHAVHQYINKKRKGAGPEAKRRKGQRRKPNAKRRKPGKKEKGQEIRHKKKNKNKKDSVVKKEGTVKVGISVKENGQPHVKEGALSRKNNKGNIRCRAVKACKKNKGVCKKKCNNKKEEHLVDGECKGKLKGKPCKKLTICCVRKCKQKGTCVGKGTCRRNCLSSETRDTELKCKKSCMCCLPTQELCPQDSKCKDIGGTCKAKCDREKVLVGICPGPHCLCCIPPVKCGNTDSCKAVQGTCRSECRDTEVRLAGNCGGKRCFCCGRPPTQCLQTPVCPGTCTQTCRGVVSLEVHCLGDFCLCCLDCSPTPTCTDAHGVCKSVCGCGEKEIPNGCKGGGCKCCVADVLGCNDNTGACKNCVYTPLCLGDPPQEHCGGVKGCSCCPAK